MAREQTRDGAHLIDLNVDYVGPRRRRGHGGAGRPAGHRVHPADHARLHRAGRAARRAGAPGRALDRQLGELRRRRRPRLALPADDGAGPRARRRGRRAVHRRGGPGPHRRLEGPDRGPAHPRPDRRTTACTSRTSSSTRSPSRSPPGRRRSAATRWRRSRRSASSSAGTPGVQTTLGISNVSFGLNAAARQVLNSVFLHECVNAGLDTAIVSAAKILPMAKIDDEQRSVALDLVYDRRRPRLRPAEPLHGAVRGRHRRGGEGRARRGAGGAAAVRAPGAADRRRRAQRAGGRPGRRAGAAARPGDHQRHAAVGDEDRRRAVRVGADAAAVRAAVAPR